MPLCSCGIKVLRGQSEVQCIVCNQVFHAACCNIGPEELEFCKNLFKCMTCLKLRRLSVSPLPVLPLNKIITDVTKSDNEIAADAGVCTGVADTQEVASISGAVDDADATIIDHSNDSNSLLAASPNVDDLAADTGVDTACLTSVNSNMDSPVPVPDRGTLELLSLEVVSLRKLTEVMASTIRSLQNANAKTNAKLDEVLALLKLNSENKSNVAASSPKRKKSKKMTSAGTSSDARSTVVVFGQSSAAEIDTDGDSGSCTASVLGEQNWPDMNARSRKSANNRPLAPNTSGLSFANAARLGPVQSSQDTAGSFASPSVSSWKRVGNSKKPVNSLIGTGTNDVIGVVNNFKWLHLSSFKNSVSETDIVNYLSKTTNIPTSNFSCFKLVKKDEDVSKLKFINFKLGIVSNYYDTILSPALWPANVRVRPFVFKEKKSVPTIDPFANAESVSGEGAVAGSFLEPCVVVPQTAVTSALPLLQPAKTVV